MDDEAGTFLTRPELYEPSKAVLDAAREALLISEEDRRLLKALLAAVERAGFPAEKAGVRGVQSTSNLVRKAFGVVAAFYLGAASSGYAEKSPLIERTANFLVSSEHEASKFFSNAPDDIRIAVHEIIDYVKKNPPSSIPPG